MTTTLSAHGGGAQPARIDSSGKVTGGAAMRVYGFASEAEAQAAGYVCEGGPAMSVALITDAQIASGAWKLDGDPFAVVIYTAPDSLPTEGGFAMPVYAVNGWGSAPAPSGPVPLLDLEADTGVTTTTTPFAASGTITQSGTTVTGDGSVSFGGEVVAGDRITANDNSINGIVQSVTSYTELELDTSTTVAVGVAFTVTPQTDSARVAGWADQSGNGHDFTQNQITRYPVLRTVGGIKMLFFDSYLDTRYMTGGNDFADNLPSFTVVIVGNAIDINVKNIVISKASQSQALNSWQAEGMGNVLSLDGNSTDDGIENFIVGGTLADANRHVFSAELLSMSIPSGHVYIDGVLNDGSASGNPITTYSNTDPVRIGQAGDFSQGSSMYLSAVRMYSPSLSPTDRAAVEAELATRYGITL